MPRSRSNFVPDLHADPFGEHGAPVRHPERIGILGCDVGFESNSPELMGLVHAAYSGLPRHRLGGATPRLTIRLVLAPPGPEERGRAGRRGARVRFDEPPGLAMVAGAGLFGGATALSSFVVLAPGQRAGLVVLSREMLRFPYHARYEFLEFAVFTLASRVRQLISLHAACIGKADRGVLLMGDSGSGKSTVSLLALLSGMDFVAEDSVFVESATLRATGVANFLHVRNDSVSWIEDVRERAAIVRAPVIRRRSGASKYEVDLRQTRYHLARRPQSIVAVLFLSAESADGPLLRPLGVRELRSRLAAGQAYAAGQAGWPQFQEALRRIEAFELRRGRHPSESVEAIRAVLARG